MSSITPLPTPPSRNAPETFSARADALLGALPTMVTETNVVAAEVAAHAADVTTKHDAVQSTYTAAMSAGLASAASNAATAATAKTQAETARDAADAAWTAALAANPDLNPVIRMNPSVVAQDTTIPSHYNAYSAGPLEIAESTTVTINDHANWSIL
jgi:hypothetical protein